MRFPMRRPPATAGTDEYGSPKCVVLAGDVYRPIIHALRFFGQAGNPHRPVNTPSLIWCSVIPCSRCLTLA